MCQYLELSIIRSTYHNQGYDKWRTSEGETEAVRWPCGVCSKGVGSNSLQCKSCQKWVHKKSRGIKGSMLKVAKSFICSGCLNPVTSASRTSMDIGVGVSG